MVQFKNFDFNTLMNKEQLTNQYEKKYLFNCYKKNGGTTFIAISNDTKKYFEQTAKPYKTSLLHNAINHQRFYRPLKKKRIGTLKLINTGSLQDKKNHAFLVTVANILKQKSISFELIFLGDGKNREKLKKNISEYNLHNNIYLQGNVENVEFFLWESHIYLHAATYEPLGLALLEAMAAGLPVITLDGKGNRDIIKQGKNGYIIFEHDAIQFSDTIIALWNDENKYQEMSTYAKEYAKKFDIKDYCNNLLKLYSSAYRSPNI
jgi:glycosyltransferase involved in cell wall biosynthesis